MAEAYGVRVQKSMHGRTYHGSEPNRSSNSRRLYINGFARAADCDHGIRVTEGGKVLPLQWGPDTRWDVVEER